MKQRFWRTNKGWIGIVTGIFPSGFVSAILRENFTSPRGLMGPWNSSFAIAVDASARKTKGMACKKLTTYARAGGCSTQGLWLITCTTGGVFPEFS